MKRASSLGLLLAAGALFSSCGNDSSSAKGDAAQADSVRIVGESFTYADGDSMLAGFIAYDDVRQGRRPVVLVVPEWWGVNDYVRTRANELARLGYLAMAVDMYGNGRTADDPQTASQLATPFYQNPQLAKRRLDAALHRALQHPQADSSKVAAIGYCFGGAMVLNYARMGAPLDGVVSFHGNLVGVPPQKDSLHAAVLVCHGAADPFVSDKEVTAFKKQMDSIGARYEFKAYENATHAFTNPQATEKGRQFDIPIAYNAAADSASWSDMKAFFGRIFQ